MDARTLPGAKRAAGVHMGGGQIVVHQALILPDLLSKERIAVECRSSRQDVIAQGGDLPARLLVSVTSQSADDGLPQLLKRGNTNG
jgi:hypothetical protein